MYNIKQDHEIDKKKSASIRSHSIAQLFSITIIHHVIFVLNSDAVAAFKYEICDSKYELIETNINRMSHHRYSYSTRPTIGEQSALNCNRNMSPLHHQSLSSVALDRSSHSNQLSHTTNGDCRLTLSSNSTLTC